VAWLSAKSVTSWIRLVCSTSSAVTKEEYIPRSSVAYTIALHVGPLTLKEINNIININEYLF
jgi:hypothetical protein